MLKRILYLLVIIFFASCLVKEDSKRYDVLLNMVYHNPGEPKWETQYTEPAYLKAMGYTGQVPKMEVQCGLTYDFWQDNIIPEKSEEKFWIERHASEVRMLLNNAERSTMPLYPFTDVLVLPMSITKKYGEEMKIDSHLSIKRERTQELLRAQIEEIFMRFPNLGGLTIRHGETYLHDTPFHSGETPARTPEEHAIMINLLRDEVCVKRNKKLFYRTWDFGYFHTNPTFYLKVTNEVEPHALLYFCIKHVNYDFNRGFPFNTTIGLGNHQQIVEISMNQAGCYGNNSHPYYIGKGIINNWSEMDEKKGIRDLINDPNIKGFWIWTGGDGWVGPYFDNELWMNLNEFVVRDFVLNPEQNEEEIFYKYAKKHLKLSDADAQKFRELCLLSTDAVYYGQASRYFDADPWWCRDQYLTAIDLKEVIDREIKEEVLLEKIENLKKWEKLEQLAYEIKMPDIDDQAFLQVSTTYARIKYEIITLIWQMQIMKAEKEKGQELNIEMTKDLILEYENKWEEWVTLKKNNPACPTLYEDHRAVHCGPPFKTSLDNLINLVSK